MLIKCKDCNQLMSKEADKCPYCGRPNKGFIDKMGEASILWFKFLFWIIVAFFLLIYFL